MYTFNIKCHWVAILLSVHIEGAESIPKRVDSLIHFSYCRFCFLYYPWHRFLPRHWGHYIVSYMLFPNMSELTFPSLIGVTSLIIIQTGLGSLYGFGSLYGLHFCCTWSSIFTCNPRNLFQDKEASWQTAPKDRAGELHIRQIIRTFKFSWFSIFFFWTSMVCFF